ncbi:MAG: glycoside hydrolase family 16 [Candidatus Taylorbacteria bacterium]|nr:glycoside hydrolase family 16 [Candidatus Taylorbacteria bacterium]
MDETILEIDHSLTMKLSSKAILGTIVCLIVIVLMSNETKNDIPLTPQEQLISGMQLTFNDDFDTFKQYLDPNGDETCGTDGAGVWQTLYYNCTRTTASNNEAQIYIDRTFIKYFNEHTSPNLPTTSKFPFSISDGVLRIEATPSDTVIQSGIGPWAKYTSGMITTQHYFSQQYGYFEIRAKLPKGKGLWPAFWLLPVDTSWPPEIDAMEAFGDTNSVNGEGGEAMIHYASHFNPNNSICGAWHDTGTDVTADFHTYGVDWEPESITYYFDGQPYANCPHNADADKPFYILVNLAVGGEGSWPGTPDATNIWPAYLEIDYVRAYQKK